MFEFKLSLSWRELERPLLEWISKLALIVFQLLLWKFFIFQLQNYARGEGECFSKRKQLNCWKICSVWKLNCFRVKGEFHKGSPLTELQNCHLICFTKYWTDKLFGLNFLNKNNETTNVIRDNVWKSFVYIVECTRGGFYEMKGDRQAATYYQEGSTQTAGMELSGHKRRSENYFSFLGQVLQTKMYLKELLTVFIYVRPSYLIWSQYVSSSSW